MTAADLRERISMKRTDDDICPLHIAAIFGHADAVRSLLVCAVSLIVMNNF